MRRRERGSRQPERSCARHAAVRSDRTGDSHSLIERPPVLLHRSVATGSRPPTLWPCHRITCALARDTPPSAGGLPWVAASSELGGLRRGPQPAARLDLDPAVGLLLGRVLDKGD